MRDGFISRKAHGAKHVFSGLNDHSGAIRSVTRGVNKQSCLAILNLNGEGRVKGYNSIPFATTPIVSTNVKRRAELDKGYRACPRSHSHLTSICWVLTWRVVQCKF